MYSTRRTVSGKGVVTLFLIVPLQYSVVLGDYNSCFKDGDGKGGHASMNATGSQFWTLNNFPGDLQSQVLDTSYWNLSTGIALIEQPISADSYIDQVFWLTTTDPTVNLSSPDLPYTGCGMKLKTAVIKQLAADHSATCGGAISKDCWNSVRELAYKWYHEWRQLNDTNGCPSLAAKVVVEAQNSDCAGVIVDTVSTGKPIFGTRDHKYLPDNPGPSCPNDVGNGSSSSAFIAADRIELVYRGNPMKSYEQEVKNTSPFLLVAWPKDHQNTSSTPVQVELVCVTPNNVLTAKSGAPMSVASWGWKIMVACTAIVAMAGL